MGAMASQITGVTIVYSIVCSGADQRKPQSSASLAFVGGIHRRSVNSPHKSTSNAKMFPFGGVIVLLPYEFIYKLSLPIGAVVAIHGIRLKLFLNWRNLVRSDIHFIGKIVLRICTKHGSETAVLCAKFQNIFDNRAISFEQARFELRGVSDGFPI